MGSSAGVLGPVPAPPTPGDVDAVGLLAARVDADHLERVGGARDRQRVEGPVGGHVRGDGEAVCCKGRARPLRPLTHASAPPPGCPLKPAAGVAGHALTVDALEVGHVPLDQQPALAAQVPDCLQQVLHAVRAEEDDVAQEEAGRLLGRDLMFALDV